jgi:hypothetical protein
LAGYDKAYLDQPLLWPEANSRSPPRHEQGFLEMYDEASYVPTQGPTTSIDRPIDR